jgi:myo-inositol-1-phosphate synthase
MDTIRVAIAGVGNCASSLVQGVEFYKNVTNNEQTVPGLMHNVLAGYKIDDIEFVAAFDVDKRKVGKDLSEAIFEKPNCTKVFCKNVPRSNVIVQKGPVFDGVAAHFADYPEERGFRVDENQVPVDVVQVLRESAADILVNYMPVGSQKATEHYAQACLDAGVAMINCMPVFIASNPEWEQKFKSRGLPIIGDDVKSQFGATIVHRVLAKLAKDRGIAMDGTYQLNVGGNTDFLNMLERQRLSSKKISKTEAVQSQLDVPFTWEKIHVGPSDYVPWINDQKICFLRIEGKNFGEAPINIEVRLSVEDSPNSGGCIIDAIRALKLARDRKHAGALRSVSSYLMKHPIVQLTDEEARKATDTFIRTGQDIIPRTQVEKEVAPVQ